MGFGRVSRLLALTVLCTAGSLAFASSPTGAAPALSSVTFVAEDGVVVQGTYTDAPAAKALILLFHQAGSSKGEYSTIAPRLASAGYASLAIDQRVGGTLFGRNETAAAIKGTASYLDAKADLFAALDWARGKRLPIILWGSSYSAALVFVVAAEDPGTVRALLAFSPGEYLGPGASVRAAAAKVHVPIFVTTAQNHGEIAAAKSILAAAPARLKVQFIPVQGGVHGSSTLITSIDPSGAAAVWRAVFNFLQAASSP